MDGNAYDSIRSDIAATYSQELERISTERRLMKIQSFAALNRRGLGFVSRERRVLLHSTSFGERIFVQYPGKESERRGPDERPWDFRPKLVMRNGIVAADLPFIAVWTDLQDVASRDRDSLPVIATLLFRMAKMTDHRFNDRVYPSEHLRNRDLSTLEKGPDVRIPYYRYVPPARTVKLLQNRLGHIGGVSVEAYLYLNEYIAQNEDCKYYYRGEHAGGKRWGDGMGRSNTLMTYVSAIGALEGLLDHSVIVNGLHSKTGVSPLKPEMLPEVTGGIVTLDRTLSR